VAFSGMSSRERTVVAVLAVVIVLALVGIGLLIAKLAIDKGGQSSGVTPAATSEGSPIPAALTATLVANPSLEEAVEEPAQPVSEQPVAIAQAKSPAPLLPVILAEQPLHGSRHYRLEITAEDGSHVRISGSWSQSAKGAGGNMVLPLPEPYEAATPFGLDITPPIEAPSSWRISVSAAPKDLLANPPALIITIWDTTGSQ